MASDATQRLKVPALMTLPEWAELTDRQQTFLAQYISAGLHTGNYDAVRAVQANFKVKDLKVAKVRAAQLLANPKIQRVIAKHFGKTELQLAVEETQRVLARTNRLLKRAATALESIAQKVETRP